MLSVTKVHLKTHCPEFDLAAATGSLNVCVYECVVRDVMCVHVFVSIDDSTGLRSSVLMSVFVDARYVCVCVCVGVCVCAPIKADEF